MFPGKALLVFFLAALAQGSIVKTEVKGTLGDPILRLVQGLGLGDALTLALNSQCDCGACEDVDPPAWLALVLRYGFSSCGGALITDRHVLTSAHCVKGLEASQVAVLLGAVGPRNQLLRDKPEAQPGEQLRLALRIASKSKMAVIKLDLPVKFSKSLSPVCLPAPAMKVRKNERAEVGGMALQDPKTLTLGALKKAGRVSHVDHKMISFEPDKGVCLAFEGWPLVRKNATNLKCELIGIQTEVTNSIKRSAVLAASHDKSAVEDSSKDSTPTSRPTSTMSDDCFDTTEFVSVAHQLRWIREQTLDATRCAPPNTASDDQRRHQGWRSNRRGAARAAKKRASEQAKKMADRNNREKRSVSDGKTLGGRRNYYRKLITDAGREESNAPSRR